MSFVRWLQICFQEYASFITATDHPLLEVLLRLHVLCGQLLSSPCFVWKYAKVLPKYSLRSSGDAIHFLLQAPRGLSRTFGDSFAYLDGLSHGLSSSEHHFRPANGVYTFETLPFLLNFFVLPF